MAVKGVLGAVNVVLVTLFPRLFHPCLSRILLGTLPQESLLEAELRAASTTASSVVLMTLPCTAALLLGDDIQLHPERVATGKNSSPTLALAAAA